MPPSFPISSSISFLPYIIWRGQDTLLTCQFHSLSEIEKRRHTHIHTLLLFDFHLSLAWSGLVRSAPATRLSQSEVMGES